MKLILALTILLFPIVAQAQEAPSTPLPSQRYYVIADACLDLASVDAIRASADQYGEWKKQVADHKCIEAQMGIIVSGEIRPLKATWKRLYSVMLAELLDCRGASDIEDCKPTGHTIYVFKPEQGSTS